MVISREENNLNLLEGKRWTKKKKKKKGSIFFNLLNQLIRSVDPGESVDNWSRAEDIGMSDGDDILLEWRNACRVKRDTRPPF